MRILIQPTDAGSLQTLSGYADAVEHAGLDGVFIPGATGLPAPLISAAAVAGVNDSILIAAAVAVGDRHPLEIAEEASVVDQASRGRLIVVAQPALDVEADYVEAVDLIRTATAAGPFEFDGRRWPVPAWPPDRESRGRRVRVTPPPFGTRLDLWVEGGDPDGWLARGLGAVIGHRRPATTSAAAIGAPRAARAEWTDADALLRQLEANRSVFGQDWAVVRAPLEAVPSIGRQVRPRLAVDDLPQALVTHWSSVVRESGD